MKNIILLVIGSLLFLLCYRVTRRQTAYVNANSASVQPAQQSNFESTVAHTKPSLVMSLAN